jgi:hypothetical protein
MLTIAGRSLKSIKNSQSKQSLARKNSIFANRN